MVASVPVSVSVSVSVDRNHSGCNSLMGEGDVGFCYDSTSFVVIATYSERCNWLGPLSPWMATHTEDLLFEEEVSFPYGSLHAYFPS